MMKIAFAKQECTFRPWHPRDGQVFSDCYALDTETTKIDKDRKWLVPDYVLGAVLNGKMGYFLTHERVAEFLRAHQNVPFTCHKASFDLGVIDKLVPELGIYSWVDRHLVWDTWLLHRLYMLATQGRSSFKKGQTTLERCAELYLGAELPKDVKGPDGEDVRTSWGQFLERSPTEIPLLYLRYLGMDVLAGLGVYRELMTRLPNVLHSAIDTWGYVSQSWLSEQIERFGPQTHHIQLAASIVLKDQTSEGLGVDVELAARYMEEVRILKEQKLSALRTAGYRPGEKGVKNQLKTILGKLVEEHKLTLPRTANGDFSTTKANLAPFMTTISFIHDLLAYNAYSKLLSTYLEKMHRPRLHPSFDVLKTTGRTSSFGELNAQNLPRDDKTQLIPMPPVKRSIVPANGYLLLTADYSAIESCTVAQSCISQFKLASVMAQAINSGANIHRMVAAHVLKKPESEVTDEDRQKAKPVNFGLAGGMMPRTLQTYALNYQVQLTYEEAVQWREGWLDLFPEMREFLRDEEEKTRYQVAARCELTPAGYNDALSRTPFQISEEDYQPTPWLGAMLLKVLREEMPVTLASGRYYSSNELSFFWSRAQVLEPHLKAPLQKLLKRFHPSPDLFKAARNYFGRAPVFTLTGRLRAGATYCARHNSVFQGLAADGAKLALWRLWRSPLLRQQGCRFVNFVHDEIVLEVPESADLVAVWNEVKSIMIAEMRRVVPDVKIKVKLAYRRRWGSDPADEVIVG